MKGLTLHDHQFTRSPLRCFEQLFYDLLVKRVKLIFHGSSSEPYVLSPYAYIVHQSVTTREGLKQYWVFQNWFFQIWCTIFPCCVILGCIYIYQKEEQLHAHLIGGLQNILPTFKDNLCLYGNKLVDTCKCILGLIPLRTTDFDMHGKK